MPGVEFDEIGLAAAAAAYVNADGSVEYAKHCTVTRTSAGEYDIVLPDAEGIVENETLILATLNGIVTPACCIKAASDPNNPLRKHVSTKDGSGFPLDSDFNVLIARVIS